jgi:AcrR family transcriptional regulator
MATTKRDPAGTQQRILNAALLEFAREGFDGARVDEIARRARINKRMLYHYFGNKEDLYREIFRRKVAAKTQVTQENPATLADALAYWYDQESADTSWIRLLTLDALGAGPPGIISDVERRQPFAAFKEWLSSAQAGGDLARLDPEHLMLALIALDMFPIAFPQLARAITGRSPTDAQFKERHKAFLRKLANQLEGQPAGARRRRAKGPR